MIIIIIKVIITIAAEVFKQFCSFRTGLGREGVVAEVAPNLPRSIFVGKCVTNAAQNVAEWGTDVAKMRLNVATCDNMCCMWHKMYAVQANYATIYRICVTSANKNVWSRPRLEAGEDQGII